MPNICTMDYGVKDGGSFNLFHDKLVFFGKKWKFAHPLFGHNCKQSITAHP